MDLPKDIAALAALIEEHGPDKVARRFRKPPIPSSLLRAYSHEPPTDEGWEFLGRYVLTPSSMLEEIVRGADAFSASVLAQVAQNPRTPPSSLTALAGHDDAIVRAAVAANPNLPVRDMEQLLEAGNPIVCASLATNGALKLKLQAQLAAHGDAATRLALTQNKSLHPDLWMALSSDPSPMVRYALAAATHAPDDMLQFWADSDREEIQLALLTRCSLPSKILHSLMLSPHGKVRSTARQSNLMPQSELLDAPTLLHLSRTGSSDERQFVAAMADAPAALQHALAQDDDVLVRTTLAVNESIWPEVAEFFISTEDVDACLALLDNPAMPEALYVELAWLNQQRITAALASSQRTPEEVLHYLVNERLSAVAIFHLAASRRAVSWLRADLASALASLPSPSLRLLAAKSPALPFSARKRLCDDPAPVVRNAAYELPPGEELDTTQGRDHALELCITELTVLINGIDRSNYTQNPNNHGQESDETY